LEDVSKASEEVSRALETSSEPLESCSKTLETSSVTLESVSDSLESAGLHGAFFYFKGDKFSKSARFVRTDLNLCRKIGNNYPFDLIALIFP
jgi:hypothetical protein